MSKGLTESLDELTAMQRQSADWEDGPVLILAGPGAGKTQVLTCRIARLLDSSKDKKFRLLALTFTNKAADEMKGRVAGFVPGLEDRATIATFHGFCAQILRQHGVHCGINSNFVIYSSDGDRGAVMEGCLRRGAAADGSVSLEDVSLIGHIDRLKSRLIDPEALGGTPERDHLRRVYELYDAELRRNNALDFNSLIQEAVKLLALYPMIAERYRKIYPHWLIDEFQDTNAAQYALVRTLAGEHFSNVFAVADDDQIIYEWNGASYRQIQSFLQDFNAGLIQLPTNFRCPPGIVTCANRLVAYNAVRTASKEPLVAGRTDLRFPAADHIGLRVFQDAAGEASGIADEIAGFDQSSRGNVAVLARTKALLEGVRVALTALNVPCVIAQRRDQFLSPEFRWLFVALRQLVRPLDQRNAETLVEAFNRFASTEIDRKLVVAEAEATNRGYLAAWLQAAGGESLKGLPVRALELFAAITVAPSEAKSGVESIVREFAAASRKGSADLAEDVCAWKELTRDVAQHLGSRMTLEEFLQELDLRSKEPTPGPNTVTLTTVHGAKGKEFEYVFVIGLAEDVMPSFQSRKKGDRSPEMEEERRNCFVAITRTRERLVLSRAERYYGWQKSPSRFLSEMGLTQP